MTMASERFCGWVKPLSNSSEVTRIDKCDRVISEEVLIKYQLRFNKVPLFAETILQKQLLTGGEICIIGVAFSIEGNDNTGSVKSGIIRQCSVEVYTFCSDADSNCEQ